MYIVIVVVLISGERWYWRQVQFVRLSVPLVQAVTNGNPAAVHTLLEQGANPDVHLDCSSEPLNLTTLWQAMHGGRPVHATLAQTVLMEAAEHNRTEILRLLLEHGADMNCRQVRYPQWTALQWAAKSGAIECIKILLSYKPDVNQRDGQGQTPLFQAIGTENEDEPRKDLQQTEQCVGLLLKQGANVNQPDKHGQTPILFALSAPSIIRNLLDHGAQVNVQDDRGETPLMWATRSVNDQKGIEVVKLLLDHGARVNTQSSDGTTALWDLVARLPGRSSFELSDIKARSLRKLRLSVLQMLLDRGADVRLGCRGKSILWLVEQAVSEQTEAMALLHKAGVRQYGPLYQFPPLPSDDSVPDFARPTNLRIPALSGPMNVR